MSKFKDRSSYRSAKLSTYKDKVYKFNIATKPSDNSLSVAASHQWIATGYGGGGSAIVVPVDYSQYKPNNVSPSVISAHSTNLTDLAFSPFHSSLLATSAADGFVKLWDIPQEGLTTTLSQATSSIEAGAEIYSMKFNPCADNVLAVATKQGVFISDIEAGGGTGIPSGSIQSVAWSPDGTKLAVTDQTNKMVFICDPRNSDGALEVENGCLLKDCRKAQYVYFLNENTIATTSVSKSNKPKFHLFDIRNLTKHTAEISIGTSTGYVLPIYDYDTKLMYTVLRSSQYLNTYDFSSKTAPRQPQNTDSFNSSVRGICLAPKSTCTLHSNEIARIYTLTDRSIESYGITIPRKIAGFDSKLFPATLDTSQASIQGTAWFEGADAKPNLIDIESLVGKINKSCGIEVEENKIDLEEHAPKSVLQKKEAEKIIPIEDVSYQETETRKRLVSKMQSSPFRHLAGNEPNKSAKDSYWYDLTPGRPVLMHRSLQANEYFLAFPWGGSGSCIRIQPIGILGRSKAKEPVFDAQGLIQAFDLSKLQPNLLATGSDTGMLKVATIPDEGIQGDFLTEAKEYQLSGKITVVKFHPHIEDVLVVATSDFDNAEYLIHLLDLKLGETRVKIEGLHDNSIIDFGFDDSANFIVTSCKDKVVRIICARTGEFVKDFSPAETLRETTPIFTDSAHILVTGYNANANLTMSLWNIVEDPKKLKTINFGSGNYAPLVHYDMDVGVVYLAKVGASSVNTIEVSTKTPYLEKLNKWSSNTGDFAGHTFQHKKFTDPKEVEIAISYKYCKKTMQRISWTVPRKRKEFFQDDLIYPTADLVTLCSADEWFNSEEPREGMTLKYIDLQPKGMVKLSDAPAEELTVRQLRYKENLRKVKEEKTVVKPTGATGHSSNAEVQSHFANLSKAMPTRNKWDAAPDSGSDDVDEDEWDD